MRIVFMGTPEFAVPSLKAMLDAGHEMVAVVTAPDKPSGRGLKLQPSAVKLFATKEGLPILQPQSLKDAKFRDELVALAPDLFVIVAFRIIPAALIDIPKFGSINLHASLLPQYRGAAPINWAIINGEPETGVTTFFIKPKVDTGDILLQEKTPIGSNETAGDLHDRLMQLGAMVVVKTVEMIQKGDYRAMPQQQSGTLRIAPKIFPAGCELNKPMTTQEAHNFIRGLSPHPGAWMLFRNRKLKLLHSVPAPRPEGTPGTLSINSTALWLSCTDGALVITEVQAEGRNKMGAAEFVRGLR